MNDQRANSPPTSDDVFLEQAVLSLRRELPDDARMRALEERLGPVFDAKVDAPGRSRTGTWLLLLGAGLIATAAGANYRDGSPSQARSEAALAPPPARAIAVVEQSAAAEQGSVPTVAVDSLPAVLEAKRDDGHRERAAPDQAVRETTTVNRPTPAGPSMSAPPDELALLEDARTALATDPRRTLALTTEHAKRYAKPSFAQERERLAIDALVRLGLRADAEARAKAFEARYPDSAHLARVRALVTP